MSLTDVAPHTELHDVDVLDLHVRSTIWRHSTPQGRVAELRFFGGLSLEETGHVLQISIATVEREWMAARAWLFSRLKAPRDDV